MHGGAQPSNTQALKATAAAEHTGYTLVAVVLCWAGCCLGSWLLLGLFRLLRSTRWEPGNDYSRTPQTAARHAPFSGSVCFQMLSSAILPFHLWRMQQSGGSRSVPGRLGEVRAPEGRASADDTAQDEQLQRSSSRKTLVGLQSASQIWDNPAKRRSQAAFPIHVTHGPWVQRIPVGPARVTYHRTVVRGVTAGEARGQRVFGRSEVAVSSVFIDTCLAPNPGSWSVLINMCMIGHRAGPPRSLTRLRMPLHCKKNMCPVCCHLSLR